MMSSTLSEETERDILPWLKIAEDLRKLKLDVEASQIYALDFNALNDIFY